MLYQDAQESLDSPQDHPMDHDRPFSLAIRGHIGQVETLRECEIALYRRTLPGTGESVFEFYVYFGAVECAISLVDFIFRTDIV